MDHAWIDIELLASSEAQFDAAVSDGDELVSRINNLPHCAARKTDGPKQQQRTQQDQSSYQMAEPPTGQQRTQPLQQQRSSGEAVQSIATITSQIATVGIPALTGLLGAYLQAKIGRKVKVKIGSVEIEASSLSQLQKLADWAREFEAREAEKKEAN